MKKYFYPLVENQYRKKDITEGIKVLKNGKLTIGVARLGKKHNLPVIGLAGAIEGPFEPLYDEGFTGIFSIQSGPLSLEESQAKAAPLIHEATSRIYRFFTSSKNHNSSHISS
jgi:glycerate kinase